jgi:hypothetical protein
MELSANPLSSDIASEIFRQLELARSRGVKPIRQQHVVRPLKLLPNDGMPEHIRREMEILEFARKYVTDDGTIRSKPRRGM